MSKSGSKPSINSKAIRQFRRQPTPTPYLSTAALKTLSLLICPIIGVVAGASMILVVYRACFICGSATCRGGVLTNSSGGFASFITVPLSLIEYGITHHRFRNHPSPLRLRFIVTMMFSTSILLGAAILLNDIHEDLVASCNAQTDSFSQAHSDREDKLVEEYNVSNGLIRDFNPDEDSLERANLRREGELSKEREMTKVLRKEVHNLQVEFAVLLIRRAKKRSMKRRRGQSITN